MTPTEFDDYLSWHGDMHNFVGEARAFGVGTRVKYAPEMGDGPSRAATTDKDSNQFQNDDYVTELDKVIRGD